MAFVDTISLDERLAALHGSAFGAVLLDCTGTVVDVSNGVLVEMGFARDELVGLNASDLVHPDDAQRATEAVGEAIDLPGQRHPTLYRLRLPGDTYGHFAVQGTSLGGKDNRAIMVTYAHPTAQLQAEAFADDAVDVMGLLADDTPLEESLDWIALVAERHVLGLQVVITMFEHGDNRIMSRRSVPPKIAEVNRAATPDRLPSHVAQAHKEQADRKWRASKKVASLDYIVPGRLTSVLMRADGTMIGYVEALRRTSATPDGSEWRVHSMISRMMTAAVRDHESDAQLRRAADIDPLTGLFNRRKLFEILEAEATLADSLLCLIDLDGFSWINNNLGHQAGDNTLRAVAEALIQVSPEHAVVARLGGDEFVVWIRREDADQDLDSLRRSFRSGMKVPAGTGDRRVFVRASTGIVRVAEGESVADGLNRADVAMYAAKRGDDNSATTT